MISVFHGNVLIRSIWMEALAVRAPHENRTRYVANLYRICLASELHCSSTHTGILRHYPAEVPMPGFFDDNPEQSTQAMAPVFRSPMMSCA